MMLCRPDPLPLLRGWLRQTNNILNIKSPDDLPVNYKNFQLKLVALEMLHLFPFQLAEKVEYLQSEMIKHSVILT